MLLKKVFNVLNSLSICISGSHSSNPRLTSHEILIPINCSVWMKKGFESSNMCINTVERLDPQFTN